MEELNKEELLGTEGGACFGGSNSGRMVTEMGETRQIVSGNVPDVILITNIKYYTASGAMSAPQPKILITPGGDIFEDRRNAYSGY